MVRIDIFRDKDGNIFKFESNGHTGYDDIGKDIVCASVSSVTFCALNGIEKVLNIDFGYQQGDGYLFFVLPDDLEKSQRDKINILLESMYLFLRELEIQYPNNLQISELEV